MSWTKNAARVALLTAGFLMAGAGAAAADTQHGSAEQALTPTIQAVAGLLKPAEQGRVEQGRDGEPAPENASTPGRPRLRAEAEQPKLPKLINGGRLNVAGHELL